MAEMDRTRKSKVPPKKKDFSRGQQGEPGGLLQKAMEQIDEQEDNVKHINALIMQSKVLTIRDKQIEENQQLE